MRSMVEGACCKEMSLMADAHSTALRAVPLPRVTGDEKLIRSRDALRARVLLTTTRKQVRFRSSSDESPWWPRLSSDRFRHA